MRSAVAGLTVLALVPEARRGVGRRSAIVGVAYAAATISFVHANTLTTAANAIFFQAAAPLYLLLLAPWLLGEPIRRQDLGFLAALAVGLALCLSSEVETTRLARAPALGNAVAALASLSWAFTIVGLRWLARAPSATPAASAVVAGNLIACAVALPMTRGTLSGSPADWAIVVYLGLFQVGLAYVFLTHAIARVPVFEASLLLLAEDALNPMLVWLVHGEAPGALALAGGGIILGTTGVKAAREGRGPGG